MDIKFNCSNSACQQKLAVDESYLGRSFPCPACGTVLLVPSPLRRIPSKPATAEPQLEVSLSLGARIFRLLIGWGVGMAIYGLLMASLHIGFTFKQFKTKLSGHLDQTTKEVTAPGGLLNVAPVSNNKETALLYERDVGYGTGLFREDLSTQARKQIALAPPARFPPLLIGWSPDDRFLAFAATSKKTPNQQILIRDGSSGAALESFDLPDSLEQGAWLSTNSLVLYARHKLYLFNFQADFNGLGRYGGKGLTPLAFDSVAVPSSLVPIGGYAVSYDDGKNIWLYNISNSRTDQLTHLTNATIGQLDYSPDNRSFLFSLAVAGKGGDPCLFRFDPRTNAATGGLAQFTDRYNFEHIYSGKWIAGGAGLVYAGPNFLGVSLNTESLSFHTNFFAGGQYQSYSVSPRGDKIFAIGSVAGEPLGIWEYDINYGELDNIVPPKEHLAYSMWAEPNKVEIARKKGGNLVYTLLPPPGLEAGKKHPAVLNLLGNNPYEAWPQLLANAGVFSVSIHPRNADDAQAIAEDLLKKEGVDPHQLYIVGQSADASMIQSLVRASPSLLHGAILLRPSEFQTLPEAHTNFPALLILGGGNNDLIYSMKAERFVRTACQKLVPCKLLFDEDILGAAPKNADLNQERYKMMIRFMLTGDLN